MSSEKDKQAKSFTNLGAGQWARNVLVKSGLEIPSWDDLDVTYPDTTSEVFTFQKSLSTVATVTVTYTDASKEKLLSVVLT